MKKYKGKWNIRLFRPAASVISYTLKENHTLIEIRAWDQGIRLKRYPAIHQWRVSVICSNVAEISTRNIFKNCFHFVGCHRRRWRPPHFWMSFVLCKIVWIKHVSTNSSKHTWSAAYSPVLQTSTYSSMHEVACRIKSWLGQRPGPQIILTALRWHRQEE